MGSSGFGNKLLDGIDLFVDINYRRISSIHEVMDDGYPSIIMGYKVGPQVVMMGSLKPHADVNGKFPTNYDAGINK